MFRWDDSLVSCVHGIQDGRPIHVKNIYKCAFKNIRICVDGAFHDSVNLQIWPESFRFFFFFIFDKFRSLNLQEKAKFWRNKKDKMKWIPLVAKTSHLVNSQLGPVAPVYSELLHYSDWEGDPWYGFNKQNSNSARASHVFANFYSPSLRYMEDISTQTQIYFSLFTLWCQCSLKIHFHRKITYIWST